MSLTVAIPSKILPNSGLASKWYAVSGQMSVVNLVFTGFGTGNLKYVKIRWHVWNGSAWIQRLETIHRPNTLNVATVDAAGICRTFLNLDDSFAHNVLNIKDTNRSARIQIKYIEGYINSSNAVVEEGWGQHPAETFFIINAARQIGEKYGTNAARNVLDHTGVDKAEIISDFTKPTYFFGLPFDLSFVYNADANVTQYLKQFVEVYAQRLGIGLRDVAFDSLQVDYMNRMLLPRSYERIADNLKVYLAYDGLPTVTRYVDADYSDADYAVVSGGGTGGPILRITKKLPIKLDYCRPANSIYVKWIGPSGGENYWLFTTNKFEGLTTTAGGLFSPIGDDLELADSDSKYLSKTATPEMVMTAERLDSDDVSGLRSLLYSPQVMWLSNINTWPDEGEKWQTFKINPAKFAIRETKSTLSKIELTGLFPQINIQTN